MANEQNLKPQSERTKKEQREIARLGGIASGKARAERKTLKEELLILLSQDDYQKKISTALLQEATKGNTKAFEVIRDTVGEKPVDKVEADIKSDIVIDIKEDEDE